MKSPPLVVWLTGSFDGGWVSSAIWRAPGAAALGLPCGAAGTALAAAVGVNAAAPAKVAPLRKLRRPIAGESSRRFDSLLFMGSSSEHIHARSARRILDFSRGVSRQPDRSSRRSGGDHLCADALR